MNYENDIRIDETALDVEWLGQAELFMKYARNAARARMELDKAKERLELAKAECDKEVRDKPGKFNIEKVTEAVVSSTIITMKKFKEANEDYLDAKYETDIAQAAVNAFNQRKEALENLVRLHGMQYFAGPKVPRDLYAEVKRKREENQKSGNEKIAGVMLRKKV